jgi:tetratricopeptide (TPR) repeat protein
MQARIHRVERATQRLRALSSPRGKSTWLRDSTTLFNSMPRSLNILRVSWLSLVIANLLVQPSFAQAVTEQPAPAPSSIASLGLSTEQQARLQRAIDSRDYVAAEELLLAEINRDPKSAHTARLLDFAGSVYFLNHDYVNAAIAWKKSEAIAPLEPSLKFSLAMAYIQMSHPDWARKALEELAAGNPKEALYPYWLGRLDYDGHEYNRAIRRFQQAIELAPAMARAYDNLGLCYYYQNQNDLAVQNYRKAIELDRNSEHPSAWPYLNLAITLQFQNDLPGAESNLREALRFDPSFAQAHFQLGLVLEDLGRLEEAARELRDAAKLNASYAEPHMALARIYRKLGQESSAREETQTYLRLHPHSTPDAPK